MRHPARFAFPFALAAGTIPVLSGCATSPKTADAPPAAAPSAPAVEVHEVGRFRFAGQPDEQTLRQQITGDGVGLVVNCRRDSEMERVPFDEAALIDDLGADYARIPMAGDAGYSPAQVDEFARLVSKSSGPVLIHCASGGRARTIWTAYLVRYEGKSIDEAIAMARQAGASDDPLQQLLGEPLSTDFARNR